jgi:RNase E specificity factor CsrD
VILVYSDGNVFRLNSSDFACTLPNFQLEEAEKPDKTVAIDRLIIETTINKIINKNIFEHSFGIDISAQSISDEHFIIWLEGKLLRSSQSCDTISF